MSLPISDPRLDDVQSKATALLEQAVNTESPGLQFNLANAYLLRARAASQRSRKGLAMAEKSVQAWDKFLKLNIGDREKRIGRFRRDLAIEILHDLQPEK